MNTIKKNKQLYSKSNNKITTKKHIKQSQSNSQRDQNQIIQKYNKNPASQSFFKFLQAKFDKKLQMRIKESQKEMKNQLINLRKKMDANCWTLRTQFCHNNSHLQIKKLKVELINMKSQIIQLKRQLRGKSGSKKGLSYKASVLLI